MEKKEKKEKKPVSRRMVLLIIILVLVIAGGGIYFYVNNSKHETTDNAQIDGTILSVRTSVGGFVKQVYFEDNQQVHKGDTLLKIEDKDYAAKVAQARAQLSGAEAQIGVINSNTQAATQNANASAENAQALKQNVIAAQTRLNRAKADLARMQNMYKDDAATRQQLDNAKAEVETAQAQFTMAVEQQLAAQKTAGGGMLSAQAQGKQINSVNALIEQRKAELDLALSQLQNTIIRAPFDGIISKKAVEPGQLLQPGQPVCSAVNPKDLWVTANFKETQLKDLRIGQPVTVTVDAYDIKLNGSVESFGSTTGARSSLLPPDNATGNYVKVTQRVPVRIKLEADTKPGLLLAPGMSVVADVKVK